MSDFPARIISVIEATGADTELEKICQTSKTASELSNQTANQIAEADEHLVKVSRNILNDVKNELSGLELQDPIKVLEKRREMEHRRAAEARIKRQVEATHTQTKGAKR